MFFREEYNYNLPSEKIAKHPLTNRSDSKLLVVSSTGELIESYFKHLYKFINSGDLLIINNTKVIPARIFGTKATGAKVEIFIEQILNEYTAYALCRIKNPLVGMDINIANGQNIKITLSEKQNQGWIIKSPIPIGQIINQFGQMPIPPYLERDAEESDKQNYQTVFAKNIGAVAAPTAGLHFDELLITRLTEKGIILGEVELQVGAGTFLPLRENDIRKHKIHSEKFSVAQKLVEQIKQTKANGNKVIAVGTTSLRAVETIAQNIFHWEELQAGQGATTLYITPGFKFKVIDRLITNFHQPLSTLLILVSTFAGREVINKSYNHALANDYRFLSYGDGMMLNVCR